MAAKKTNKKHTLLFSTFTRVLTMPQINVCEQTDMHSASESRSSVNNTLLVIVILQIGYMFSFIGWINNANLDIYCVQATRNTFYTTTVTCFLIYHTTVPMTYAIRNDQRCLFACLYTAASLTYLYIIVYKILFSDASFSCVVPHVLFLDYAGFCQSLLTCSLIRFFIAYEMKIARALIACVVINVLQVLIAYQFFQGYSITKIATLIASVLTHHVVFVLHIEHRLPKRIYDVCHYSSSSLIEDSVWV